MIMQNRCRIVKSPIGSGKIAQPLISNEVQGPNLTPCSGLLIKHSTQLGKTLPATALFFRLRVVFLSGPHGPGLNLFSAHLKGASVDGDGADRVREWRGAGFCGINRTIH